MPTNSTFGFLTPARKTRRPIRPNPLIATFNAMTPSSFQNQFYAGDCPWSAAAFPAAKPIPQDRTRQKQCQADCPPLPEGHFGRTVQSAQSSQMDMEPHSSPRGRKRRIATPSARGKMDRPRRKARNTGSRMSGVSLPVNRPTGRAIVVGSAGCRAAAVQTLRGLGYESVEAEDPYSAAAELARRSMTYRAMILCLNSLYREELAFIASIKHRYPHIDIWLSQTDGRAAALAEAL